MRIVTRKEFLMMPSGTLFMKYEPQIFGELKIKEESYENDFNYVSLDNIKTISDVDESRILSEMESDSSLSYGVDFYTASRDGLFEEDQLFAVYEQDDLLALISRLKECSRERI